MVWGNVLKVLVVVAFVVGVNGTVVVMDMKGVGVVVGKNGVILVVLMVVVVDGSLLFVVVVVIVGGTEKSVVVTELVVVVFSVLVVVGLGMVVDTNVVDERMVVVVFDEGTSEVELSTSVVVGQC